MSGTPLPLPVLVAAACRPPLSRPVRTWPPWWSPRWLNRWLAASPGRLGPGPEPPAGGVTLSTAGLPGSSASPSAAVAAWIRGRRAREVRGSAPKGPPLPVPGRRARPPSGHPRARRRCPAARAGRKRPWSSAQARKVKPAARSAKALPGRHPLRGVGEEQRHRPRSNATARPAAHPGAPLASSMAAVRREPRPGQGAPGAQRGKPGTVSAPAVASQRTDRHWRWPGSVRQPGRRERRPGFPGRRTPRAAWRPGSWHLAWSGPVTRYRRSTWRPSAGPPGVGGPP